MTRRLLVWPLCWIAAFAAAACSPGTLPGSPTPITAAGGGARYNGTITVRRIAGNYTLSEASQALTLSLTARGPDQIDGRFESGASTGSITGVLDGNLAGGTFQATVLISTPAQQAGAPVMCEGRGSVSGTLSGVNLTWTANAITYDNCSGLTTSSQAQAVATSPIPGSASTRASVVVAILGGTQVAAGTCPGGSAGYPFTVEIIETSGLDVTFDSTFMVEERRAASGLSTTTLDMPFTDLRGGSRRTYGACSPVPGTYQAFFRGTDAGGNVLRVASPVVVLGSGAGSLVQQ